MIELIQALCALRIAGTVTFQYITTDRIEVHVNGRYFGVWDMKRKTFVD